MKEQLSKLFSFSGKEEKEIVKEIELKSIYPNPYQPRKVFDEENLEELAQSIKEYGVIQPVVVRPMGESFELVAGERRFRASKRLKLPTIPAIVKDLNDQEIAEIALIENLHRDNLNFFEEAEGYKKLIKEFKLTQKEVAEKFGKSQSTIANKLRILNLSPFVVNKMDLEKISERHARALLKLKDEASQIEVLELIQKEGLNVRQTDLLVEQILEEASQEEEKIEEKPETPQEKKKKKKIKRQVKMIYNDMRIFLNTIRGAVDTIQQAGLPAAIEENELEDYIEVTIKLPKK